MKKFSPNTKLPAGATLLKRVRKLKIGNWVEMEYDAAIMRNGITWLRVKGGFSQDNQREDWIAELPHSTCSVSDYNWRKDADGFVSQFIGTFTQCMDAQLKEALEQMEADKQEHFKKSLDLQESISKIEKALKQS